MQNNSKEISAYTNRMSKQTSGKTNGSHNNSNSINNMSLENGQTAASKKSPSSSLSGATVAAVDVNRRCKVVPMQGNENGNGVADDDNNNDDEDDNENDEDCSSGSDSDAAASINGTTTSTSGKHAKLNRQSSAETSIDDVNNKLTSHAFQSYDEQEHLEESKEIKSPTTENIPI